MIKNNFILQALNSNREEIGVASDFLTKSRFKTFPHDILPFLKIATEKDL